MPTGTGTRREKRITAVLPIRLWGMDANGKPFIEASKTVNVSRSGVLLTGIPHKLVVGDVIGLRCKEKKYRFRVIWVGEQNTPDAGSIGLQCLETGKWIWEDLRLPIDDVDIYARPLENERRQLNRIRCFLSAEVICKGQKVLAFVRDLSRGGCYVAMSFPFPLESYVSLAVWMNDQTKLWVDGVVISSHASSGMGIKFLGLTHANLQAVERCVTELQKAESSEEPGTAILIDRD